MIAKIYRQGVADVLIIMEDLHHVWLEEEEEIAETSEIETGIIQRIGTMIVEMTEEIEAVVVTVVVQEEGVVCIAFFI